MLLVIGEQFAVFSAQTCYLDNDASLQRLRIGILYGIEEGSAQIAEHEHEVDVVLHLVSHSRRKRARIEYTHIAVVVVGGCGDAVVVEDGLRAQHATLINWLRASDARLELLKTSRHHAINVIVVAMKLAAILEPYSQIGVTAHGVGGVLEAQTVVDVRFVCTQLYAVFVVGSIVVQTVGSERAAARFLDEHIVGVGLRK